MLRDRRPKLLQSQRGPYDAEIEYIQSSNTLYIDTGVKLTGPFEMHLTFGAPTALSESYGALFGVGNGGGATNYNYCYCYCTGTPGSSSTSLRFYNKDSSGSYNGMTAYQSYPKNHIIFNNTELTKWKTSFNNGTESSVSNSSVNYTKASLGNVYLFCMNKTLDGNGNAVTATPRYYTSYKLYRCKFYVGGNLVRDFIPVRKDGVGGLYDKVTKTVFFNAGTEDFTLGPDVQEVNTEYVDLGLPSGTLWAKYNIGSHSYSEPGEYYEFGAADNYFGWDYRAYSARTSSTSSYPTYISLSSTEDTATCLMGPDWRTPTRQDWVELDSNTTKKYDSTNNTIVYTSNINSALLVFPATGYWYNGSFTAKGTSVSAIKFYAWQADVSNNASYASYSYGTRLSGTNMRLYHTNTNYRYYGYTIRGVMGDNSSTYTKKEDLVRYEFSTTLTSSLSHNYTADEFTIPITSTGNGEFAQYYVVSCPSWTTVTANEGYATITLSKNESVSNRTDNIVLGQNRGAELSEARITIGITQTGDDQYIFDISSNSVSHVYQGASSSITVTSTHEGNSQSWSVSSKPDWVTTSISGDTITITTSNNPNWSSRSGNVTVKLTGSNYTKNISVTLALNSTVLFSASGELLLEYPNTTTNNVTITSKINGSNTGYSISNTKYYHNDNWVYSSGYSYVIINKSNNIISGLMGYNSWESYQNYIGGYYIYDILLVQDGTTNSIRVPVKINAPIYLYLDWMGHCHENNEYGTPDKWGSNATPGYWNYYGQKDSNFKYKSYYGYPTNYGFTGPRIFDTYYNKYTQFGTYRIVPTFYTYNSTHFGITFSVTGTYQTKQYSNSSWTSSSSLSSNTFSLSLTYDDETPTVYPANSYPETLYNGSGGGGGSYSYDYHVIHNAWSPWNLPSLSGVGYAAKFNITIRPTGNYSQYYIMVNKRDFDLSSFTECQGGKDGNGGYCTVELTGYATQSHDTTND